MKVLVTGGGGFLGGRIVRMFHTRGDEVVALGRSSYPQLERDGIQTVRADLRDAEAIGSACRGMDAVVHVGALTGIWGDRRAFREINVGGTENVIDACRRHGIGRLIFTSTPSVVFGKGDICGVDESYPYADRHVGDYPRTKAAAERLVLAANAPDLATVALRPHLIWGPGDPHIIPRLVDRARRGRLLQVGDGSNLVDITYIDNAADAHLLACDRLKPGSPCAGRAYFISQGEPVSLWPWINRVLGKLGAPLVTRSVSFAVAYQLGALLECVYRILRLGGEPPMTRFVATQFAKSHYFNISAARRDLGYSPCVSEEEGVRRLVESYRQAESST